MEQQPEPMEISGHCLCGSITYNARTTGEAGVCHCKMCRRWSGGAAFGVETKGEVKMTGEEHLSIYNSSAWGERGFCSKCGTNLFWRMKDGSHFGLMAGSLNDDSRLRFTTQIFIDNKPGYYDFANPTKNMTQAEIMAMFTPEAPPLAASPRDSETKNG